MPEIGSPALMAAYLPTMAAFWIGPYLGWVEQMCLLSFVKHGHRVILYAHGEVRNAPPGIEVRPASEIFDAGNIKIFQGTDMEFKPIPFDARHVIVMNSDFFRWNLQAKTDFLYIDADYFCLKPFSLFSRQELVRRGFVARVSFLRMPENSPSVKLVLDFLAQKYPIPKWFSVKKQRQLRWLKFTGRGLTISHLPFTVAAGPLFRWALRETREGEKINQFEAVLNLTLYDRLASLQEKERKRQYILDSPAGFQSFLSEGHENLYVCDIGWRQICWLVGDESLEREYLTSPPPGSWLAQQAAELGVHPPDAPVLETREKNLEYAISFNKKNIK